jgi:peptidoglycan/xylan/chitin deacetylase (PgdA/CDA1 family)
VLAPQALAWREWNVGPAAAAAAVEARGATAAALYHRHPPTLPQLPIGALGGAPQRRRLLHALAFATRLPPSAIGMLVRAAAATGRDSAFERFYEHLYLRGVRRAMPTRDAWRRLVGGTAILMYHSCGLPGEAGSRYRVAGDEFAWQMRWLKRRGYRPLSLREYLRLRAEGVLPPPKSVVVTFDDGYTDNLTAAYPVLRAHGIPATIFVVTAAVGGTNQWDPGGELVGRPLLSWDELARLANGGVETGAHTRSHRWLTTVDAAAVVDEVAGSRADIERTLGHAPVAFAYPGGRHDARSEAAVRASFAAACSTIWGLNDAATDPALLRRVDVSGEFSRPAFAWALAFGSYPPWLRGRARRRLAAAGPPPAPALRVGGLG